MEAREAKNHVDDTTPYTAGGTGADIKNSHEKCAKNLFKWF